MNLVLFNRNSLKLSKT